MNKIKLFNRDGADLNLVQKREIEPGISEWELQADDKHDYILKYTRYIMDNGVIEAIDPSGGPFISLGDEFNDKYKIVKINNAKSLWLSERNNNK